MNHEQALLAAIVENPQDDTPRLIFADWLEEQGQEEKGWDKYVADLRDPTTGRAAVDLCVRMCKPKVTLREFFSCIDSVRALSQFYNADFVRHVVSNINTLLPRRA